jgi:hypothetical protein
VVLTFLGFARLERRPTALDTRTGTFGCTAQALYFAVGGRHGSCHFQMPLIKLIAKIIYMGQHEKSTHKVIACTCTLLWCKHTILVN